MTLRDQCVEAAARRLEEVSGVDWMMWLDDATAAFDAILETINADADATGASSRSWERQAVQSLRNPNVEEETR